MENYGIIRYNTYIKEKGGYGYGNVSMPWMRAR